MAEPVSEGQNAPAHDSVLPVSLHGMADWNPELLRPSESGESHGGVAPELRRPHHRRGGLVGLRPGATLRRVPPAR